LVTLAIALVGVLLIGGFLVYHKLLMPTPEDLGSVPVALPTPDTLRNAPAIELPKQEEPAVRAPEPAPKEEAPASLPEPEVVQAPTAVEPEVIAAPAEPASEPAPAAEQELSPAYTAALKEARTLGFKKSAEQAYLTALALQPSGAEALSGLAMFYLNQGKNEPARDRAQQAVAVDPKSSEGWIVLGAALSALGDSPGSRKAYQECAGIEGKFNSECRRMLR
jgi:tetratricopeptide (TPR) repeat protein